MSSSTTAANADSLKQPAEDKASNEPSSKKAKLADSEVDAKDANNGTTANEKVSAGSNNGKSNINNNNNKTPNKALNGNTDKLPEEAEVDDVDDEFDDDDDDGDDDDAESTNQEAGAFDPKIAKSLEQVDHIQTEICNLNEKASEEILKVEQKFNKLRRPHFEKRNELLKEIPNFWLTSLANHPTIAPMIESAEDEDCLHYMVNLDVEEFEDIKSGYKLKLHFVENPYIANDVIVKEFQILSSEEVVSGSTPIEYKDTNQGKALKQIVENSIAQYRRTRRVQQSFFAWLVEPTQSGTDEIAEILKDQIFPNPLEFFFATPEDYEAGTDESDDEDEEIDDEEIDDEEDGVIPGGIDYSDEEVEGEDGEEEIDEEDVE